MVNEIITYLQGELAEAADTIKAVQMKAYMKDKFEFAGVTSPVRKDIIKHAFGKFIITSESELLELTRKLWEMPQREYQYFALDFLYKYRKLISATSLHYLEYFITTKSWWDTVDPLGADIAGFYFEKYPEQRLKEIGHWLQSGNMWLHRSAIIHQLFYKEKTDTELLKKCILHGIESKEFFIQKAIGWALRQHARIDAEYVLDFVNTHPLKPLSKREAMKHL